MANDAVVLSELDSLDEDRAWSFFESARDSLDSFTLSISTFVDDTSDRLVDTFLPESSSSSGGGGGGGATYDDARSEDSDDRDDDDKERRRRPPRTRTEPSLDDAQSALRDLLGRHAQSLKQRGDRLSRLEETAMRAGDRSHEIRENSARLRRLAEQEQLQEAADGDSCCALL